MRSGLDQSGFEYRPFEFSVEQFVRAIRADEFRVLYWLINCFRRPGTGQDNVRLDNNAKANDNGIVLLDARRAAGCANDEVWRGTGSIPIDNALSSSTCRSEAAVFSSHHAVQFMPDVTTWTDAVGDLLPVPLGRHSGSRHCAIFAPRPPFTTTSGTGHGDTATDDLGRANYLYGSMNCGVALQSTIIDATANPNAPALLTRKCSQAASLRTQIGFQPGKLNAYYLYDVLRDDNMGWAKGGELLVRPGHHPRNARADRRLLEHHPREHDPGRCRVAGARDRGRVLAAQDEHDARHPADQSDERRNHRARTA